MGERIYWAWRWFGSRVTPASWKQAAHDLSGGVADLTGIWIHPELWPMVALAVLLLGVLAAMYLRHVYHERMGE